MASPALPCNSLPGVSRGARAGATRRPSELSGAAASSACARAMGTRAVLQAFERYQRERVAFAAGVAEMAKGPQVRAPPLRTPSSTPLRALHLRALAL